jgi:hypothetical protein
VSQAKAWAAPDLLLAAASDPAFQGGVARGFVLALFEEREPGRTIERILAAPSGRAALERIVAELRGREAGSVSEDAARWLERGIALADLGA